MSNTQNSKPKGPFSVTTIKSFKPQAKDYKMTDGGGLYLLVKSNGSILWRFNYRYRGKQKTLALGQFGESQLLPKEARKLHTYGQKYLAGQGDLVLIYPQSASFTNPLLPFEFSGSLRLLVLPYDLEHESLVGFDLAHLPLISPEKRASQIASESKKDTVSFFIT